MVDLRRILRQRYFINHSTSGAMENTNEEDYETIDALWAAEAERRAREIEEGIVEAIPGEEVMQRLRSRYKPT